MHQKEPRGARRRPRRPARPAARSPTKTSPTPLPCGGAGRDPGRPADPPRRHRRSAGLLALSLRGVPAASIPAPPLPFWATRRSRSIPTWAPSTGAIEQAIAPGSAQVIRLHMSYRSTKEIVQFSRVDRPRARAAPTPSIASGAKPLILRSHDPARLSRRRRPRSGELHEAGARSVAIICKTAAQSQEVPTRAPKERLPCISSRRTTTPCPGAIVVIPAYLAKGLEFDGVLIYDAERGNVYHDESERKLFYTACTRALHHLHLMYTGPVDALSRRSESRPRRAGGVSRPW